MAQSAQHFAALLQEGINTIANRTSKPKGVIRDELGYAIGRKGGSAIEYWAYGDGRIPKQHAEVAALARVLVEQGNLDVEWLLFFLESAGYSEREKLVSELFPEVPLCSSSAQLSSTLPNLPIDAIPEPGPLPSGSIMPLSKNPFFVGRQRDLRELAAALNSSSTAAVSQVETAAATGLGGMGKTQLACEFVHRYGQFFPGGVFWLSFDNADSVPAEIAQCGGAGALDLHPDFGQRSLADQVSLVQKAWQESIPRLLVFDNCEALELLTQWRPTNGGCRIIITSRRGDWEPTLGVAMVALNVLSRAESLDLLRSYFPQRDNDYVDSIIEELNAIAEELGDLPLALHLAGSYLHRHPSIEPAAYLTQLRDPALLQHPSMQGDVFSPTGHIQHVGRTFALSYDRLDPQNETDVRAIKLLVHAAHFAPGEPIWYRLLVKTLELDLDNPEDAHKADAAFARLIELGIIEREENDSLRMHRLVARFVRDAAKEEVEATQKAVEAVVFEETASVNRDVRPMPLLAWQLHLRSVADIAQVREDEESARLCHELGKHLWQIGDFEGALRYTEKALSLFEAIVGEATLQTAETLDTLGRILRALDRRSEVKPHLEKALAIQRTIRGEMHIETAKSLDNLGRYWHEEEDLPEKALHYLERALAICNSVQCKETALTAEIHNDLGRCLRALGREVDALTHYQQALAINTRVLGDEHPHTGLVHNNIGALHHMNGRFDEALPHYKQALSIRKKAYGNMHPDTAQALNNLGVLLRETGALQECQPYLEEALKIMQYTTGAEHRLTAIYHRNLAILYQRSKRLEDARTHYERTLQIRERVLGAEHPLVMEAKQDLANLGSDVTSF